MAQSPFGGLVPLFFPNAQASSSGSRVIAASGHYVSNNFFAAKTGTIDRVSFETATVTSWSGTLEAAITLVDSSGYPSTDVSKSSDYGSTATSMASNTFEELTLSASVTAGNFYAAVVRCTSWTAGSAGVRSGGLPTWADSATYLGYQVPGGGYSLGTPNRANIIGSFGVRYGATDGYLPTLGLGGPSNQLSWPVTASPVTGRAGGNVFTTKRPFTICGFVANGEWDYDCEFGIYPADSNTARSGMSVTLDASQRASTATGTVALFFPPKILPAGTWRIAVKLLSDNAINVARMRYPQTARLKQIWGDFGGVKSSEWTGSAWEEYPSYGGYEAYWYIFPITYAMPDDSPIPQFALGL